tara:strand:- start:5752 stop:5994 length:243 start_codon:yes stop_codon:yes gene_type:complete
MEEFATQIDRYGLEDVYAFSTDFPHEEGGRDPIGRLGGNVSRLGNEMRDRFFVTNGNFCYQHDHTAIKTSTGSFFFKNDP